MRESPSTTTSTTTAHTRVFGALWMVALIGSAVMVALGLAIAGLGLLPSDAPSFFLFLGLHVTICGGLGLVHQLTRGRGWLRVVLRLASATVNGALVVRIAMLVLDGTVGGVIVVAAPLLLALPAMLNIVVAAIGLGRESSQHACENCGYDIRGLRMSVCPECGCALCSLS